MLFKNLCFLVLWTNVASALEGLSGDPGYAVESASHTVRGGRGGCEDDQGKEDLARKKACSLTLSLGTAENCPRLCTDS